jgi:hypothetical protein
MEGDALAKFAIEFSERLGEGSRSIALLGFERVSEPGLICGGPSAHRRDHDPLGAGEATFGCLLELRAMKPHLSSADGAYPKRGSVWAVNTAAA